jgi:hypothetical protein
MCANISYILINVNRYMLIGRNHNLFLQMMAKWSLKRVIGASATLSSALLNTGHLFQFQFNDGTLYKDPQVLAYLYMSCPAITDNSTLLYSYQLVYFTINYFLFFLANTWVEVTIVRKLHTELADKRQRRGHMSNQTAPLAVQPSTSTSTAFTFRRRRKQEIEERTEQRAIIMVVINALVNFFFRLPELFFFFSITSGQLLNDFFPTLRLFTTDFAYFCYILTLSSNFVIYYLFNLKFKQTFAEWRHFKKRN